MTAKAARDLIDSLRREHHLIATLREYPQGGWNGDVVLDGPCFILEFSVAFEDLRRAIEPVIHAAVGITPTRRGGVTRPARRFPRSQRD